VSEKEVPDLVYEMDTDRMIQYLTSEKEAPTVDEGVKFEPIKDKNVRNMALEYYIKRTQSGEPVDVSVLNYVLGNLQLIVDGQDREAFAVRRGRDTLSEVDHRWRACVVRYLNDLGITQLDISEIIGVSERLINDWIRYTRTEVYSYSEIAEFMGELTENVKDVGDARAYIRILEQHRRILIR
jgi:hypothetical protein